MTIPVPNGTLFSSAPGNGPRGNAQWLVARFCLMVLALLSALPAKAQASGQDFLAVQAREMRPRLVAYGQVEPIAIVPVAPAEAGVVTNLRVRPGTRVRAGEELARLSGPAISSLLLQSEADVRSARAQLAAAQKSLEIERQQLPVHLTTRQAVQQAESAETEGRSALDNAQSKLTAVREMMTLTAPADAVVLSLDSAEGALVQAGQTILTLQPSGGLWLRAMYYGPDLEGIRVGMTGSFVPSDHGQAIPVRVVAIPGTMVAGGGESIALAPVNSHFRWLSGEAGKVTLQVPARTMVEVPTRALIVNRGTWWVLVHTAHGNHPRKVIPGPAEGWNTFIESGLAPGTEIVVNNAYLLFHSGVAEQFQIPD